jgi:hypothetical protein
MAPVKHIGNLAELNHEIHRLQFKTRELEKKLDEKINYLQDNYSSMMMKSFIPAIIQKTGIVGSVVGLVFQNRRLQDSLSRLADQLFDKVSDGMEFIAEKLDKKKKPDE